jgi:hypothetical protein
MKKPPKCYIKCEEESKEQAYLVIKNTEMMLGTLAPVILALKSQRQEDCKFEATEGDPV